MEDPPDSFYEFTADDYTRVARGWGANTATGPAANAPLKTARMRAADAAAAAQKVGPVPVRVYGFGNDMALQATLSATDPVSALQVRLYTVYRPGGACMCCCQQLGPDAAQADCSAVMLPGCCSLFHRIGVLQEIQWADYRTPQRVVVLHFAGAGSACMPAGNGRAAAVHRAAQGRTAAAAGAGAQVTFQPRLQIEVQAYSRLRAPHHSFRMYRTSVRGVRITTATCV